MPITIDGNGTIAGLSSGGIAANTITAATIASGQTFSLNGIAFSATQVASSDANTLDDYEEGTWTPVVTSASGSITSYSASGWYTKVGNLINCTMYISITNNGTGSNQLYATAPFTPSSTSNLRPVGAGRENANTGKMVEVTTLGGGDGRFQLMYYDNTYPGATSNIILCSVAYFI